ncbi:hypothetical protein M0R45_001939 [Rubus argutus]|uniref:AB hydrolase-1 domain-containing protein n=1 Tax=Rubus argutus TaxID=59490 RepID=A0AAW1VKW4_RUBAR
MGISGHPTAPLLRFVVPLTVHPSTAPRIKLRDGRYLAYKEHGVSKQVAKYNIIFVHGFGSSRHDALIATQFSPELVEDLGVYIVSFDRPGYGESDPDPKRTVKSLALDIEELADQLGLGSKFYVVGYSMGGQVIWSCLQYIPHRLAGATLHAPVINYWWPGFPANLSTDAYYKQPPGDQWALRVAHHERDGSGRENNKPQGKQQGEFESVHRDLMIGFGNWEFDPIEIKNPFPNNEGSVHLWPGWMKIGLSQLNFKRYIVGKLPWIHYHELPGSGHLFPYKDGMSEAVLKAMLTGGK